MSNKIITTTSSTIRYNINFLKDYSMLLKNTLKHGSELNLIQIKRLLESALIFSLNDDEFYQKLALKIATYILKYKTTYKSIPYLAQLIIVRLGDVPVISHMIKNEDGEDYFSFNNESEYIIPYLQFPEILSTKKKNQIQIMNKKIQLTNFQKDRYEELNNGDSLIFSAPPSAGKSYIIHNYIIKQIITRNEYCVIYVVPTKELLAEVQDSLLQIFNNVSEGIGSILITNSINKYNIDHIKKNKKKILALTPERLSIFLSNYDDFNVDLLVIDEIQKINDDSRGIILLDVIEDAISRNINMQKIFISPNTNNLDAFKTISSIKNKLSSSKVKKSPVSQNILFVNMYDEKIQLSLLVKEFHFSIPLLTKKHNDIPDDIDKCKSLVINELLYDHDHTLIYCNTRKECKLVAGSINGHQITKSNDIEVYLKSLKEHIHEDYDLIDDLQRNVGYHHGKMPQFVRHIVKTLFDMGIVKFLCCTSTLLEGVNLPAKNIVIHRPKLGVKNMDKSSFLNLAGRAGRLQKDYYGNIYCINTKNYKLDDKFDDKDECITSTLERILLKNPPSLSKHLYEYNKNATDQIKTTITSIIFHQLFDPNYIDKLYNLSILSKDTLDKFKMDLQVIFDTISELDKNIIKKNRVIDARLQYDLYIYLKKSKLILPPYPNELNFSDELEKIFSIISKILLHNDTNSYKHFTKIAKKWIGHLPYKIILQYKIAASEYNPLIGTDKQSLENSDDVLLRKKAINVLIDDFDNDLEKHIKFVYTKNLQCYCDIIKLVMKENDDRRTFCEALPEYLEAGAHDERILILLNLGISRNTALNIYKYLKNINNATECIGWLKSNISYLENKLDDIQFDEIKMRLKLL